jgi:hypothetical protein
MKKLIILTLILFCSNNVNGMVPFIKFVDKKNDTLILYRNEVIPQLYFGNLIGNPTSILYSFIKIE